MYSLLAAEPISPFHCLVGPVKSPHSRLASEESPEYKREQKALSSR